MFCFTFMTLAFISIQNRYKMNKYHVSKLKIKYPYGEFSYICATNIH